MHDELLVVESLLQHCQRFVIMWVLLSQCCNPYLVNFSNMPQEDEACLDVSAQGFSGKKKLSLM